MHISGYASCLEGEAGLLVLSHVFEFSNIFRLSQSFSRQQLLFTRSILSSLLPLSIPRRNRLIEAVKYLEQYSSRLLSFLSLSLLSRVSSSLIHSFSFSECCRRVQHLPLDESPESSPPRRSPSNWLYVQFTI